MIPPESSLAAHKLHAESNQGFKPAGRPLLPPQSAHSPSFSADSPSSAMGIYGAKRPNRGGSISGAATSSPPNNANNNRDSHDLQLSIGSGRESLVDNLLLSFDKLGGGPFGAFDGSPYFSTVDELDDDEDSASSYSQRAGPVSRGGRSNNSNNYHSHMGNFPGGASHSGKRVDPFDIVTDGFGAGYDTGREVRSRGRGLGSSHGFSNNTAYDTYHAAPPPSVRSGPRIRTPSPPRSPRLVRRPSNKSAKSLRRDHHAFNSQLDDPIALPPLPAFVNQATASPMSPPNKGSGRPGFFRRVFGGGGGGGNGSSGNNSNSLGSKSIIANSTVREHSTTNSQPLDSPQSTINKKTSFFRRRKKSVSDAITHPVLSLPSHHAEQPPLIETSHPSPATSLSTAMNPYLRSPVKSPNSDKLSENHESAYTLRGATIRTVASSDPISPKRPAFFGESTRHRDSGSHFNGEHGAAGKTSKKDTRYARGGGNVDRYPRERDEWDRPQTSPYSPNKQSFLRDGDDEDKEMRWPPSSTRPLLSTRRSVDNVVLERERQVSIAASRERARQGSVPTVAREQPIAAVRELEARHAKIEQQKVEAPGGKPLEVNTQNLGANTNIGPETSWLCTPTPATAGTPTVMLQRDGPGDKAEPLQETESGQSSGEELEIVRGVFRGDEGVVAKARVTAWLGESSAAGARIRKAYMGLFDWNGVNILSSLRIFCGRLVFKGETQQVDRIMDAIAKRWSECNPRHGFKCIDVIFTILYSLLLLNTDLHLADIPQSQKMTRSQFIKNTMNSIRRVLAEATPEARPTHHNTFPPRSQTPFRTKDDNGDSPGMPVSASSTFPLAARERKMSEPRTSSDFAKGTRNSSKTSGIGNLSPKGSDDPGEKTDNDMDGGLALVKAPSGGGIRAWESQLEVVLKDFYQSIKTSALPLHGASQERLVEAPNQSSLSVFGSNMLRRSPSNVSRAPSELSVSGRNRENKLGAKWTAKNRSRPRLYNGSFAGSSRTSLEDRSMWSPSASSTWSKYSLDKTQTSMSVESLGSAFTHGDYQQSIGFANALSHAIIREEAASGTSAEDRESTLLDYDELELVGAPWAKEGMLKHKHHLESMDKKAKNRVWTECFAVIERGWMRLFQFNQTGKSKDTVVGVVGGGNWTENADAIGSFLLRQTIASALPPPGYSRTRPNVWALSLPSGAVHFFEVGTPEIVREFVSTANYWAARLSKEPLIGGVSNVEYGWSDSVLGEVDTSLTSSLSHTNEPRPSLQVSIRSSLDHGSTARPKLPGDRANIMDWAPPSQSMVASSLGEADQLKALETYVGNIEAELARHNELRPTMIITFSPRHPNSSKAMNNWEKKSSYLLMEIIKFRTYIECLASATALRERLCAGENDRAKVGDTEPRSPAASLQELRRER